MLRFFAVRDGLVEAVLHPAFVARQQAGGCPAATHFLLRRQKKVSKEKATLLSATPFAAATGATCGARSSRGLPIGIEVVWLALLLLPA